MTILYTQERFFVFLTRLFLTLAILTITSPIFAQQDEEELHDKLAGYVDHIGLELEITIIIFRTFDEAVASVC